MMRSLFIILIVITALHSFSQEVNDERLEDATGEINETIDEDHLISQLMHYKKHPLNINKANEADLSVFSFLNAMQVHQLLQYRKILGAFSSVYELQAIPGWNTETARALSPYVTVVSAVQDLLHVRDKGVHTLILREQRILQKQKGFRDNSYLGSRDHLLFRYHYRNADKLMFGITAEKDAGEELFRGSQKHGFDHYGFHLFIKNNGLIKTIAIGDYMLNLGQGLIQWQSFSFGKGSDAMAIKKQGNILLPYRSPGESIFMRGVAITTGRKKLSATIFISSKKQTASIKKDSTGKLIGFGSVATSGLHRTESEIAAGKKTGLTMAGVSFQWKTNNAHLASNHLFAQYSLPHLITLEDHNVFDKTGKTSFLHSVDYNYTFSNAHLFGEFAMDKYGRHAMINGLLVVLHQKLNLSLLYRDIHKGYNTIYGKALTENAEPGNESGFYMGIQTRPQRLWQLDVYADVFRFPWLKYQADGPSYGKEFMLKLIYKPSKQLEIYTRLTQNEKWVNDEDEATQMKLLLPRSRRSARVHLSYQFRKTLSFKLRTEQTGYYSKDKKEEGILYFLHAQCNLHPRIKFNGRWTWFETGGYDSRVYMYENDVLFSSSVPSFYGRGNRYFINLSWQPAPGISAWLKYGTTIYRDRESVGSGAEQINGKSRSEVKLQLVFTAGN